jgi:DNA repair exonuclease SbcCD ATPase subunit
MIIGTIKKVATTGAVITVISLSTVPAFAQVSPTQTPKQAQKTANQTQRVQDLKTKGDQLISDRLTSLNTLLTRINNAKLLTADQKSQFVSQIQANISGLTQLKTKIDADTDITTMRADVKSIFTGYRIYAVANPKVRIQAASDTMTAATDKLSALADKLQTLISQAQSQGKDVSALNASLTDLRNKIADAKTQYQNAEGLVSPLTPASYPGSTQTIKQARTDIKAGQTDLKAGRTDINSIRQGIKGMGLKKPTPTP